MSTVLDLISASLTEIGQLGRGQTAAPEDGAQGLRELNLLLSQKSTQRLFLSYVSTRQYTLTPTADYTIGPTGATFTAPRPTLIESAQVNVTGNYWVPISVWNKPQWDAIRNRGVTGEVPDGIYVEYTFPNIAFHVSPIPLGSPSIKLGAWEELAQFSTIFDIIQMPPAYEAWMEIALAIILAPFYDQPVPGSLIDRRGDTLNDLQSYNAKSMMGRLSAADQFESANIGQPMPPTGATAAGPQQ